MHSRLADRRAGALLIAGLLALSTYAPEAAPATDVGSPSAAIVSVSSEGQLQQAVQNLRSNTTIVLSPGTYVLTSTLWIRGPLTDVGIRGATQNFNDVTIVGPGMSRASYGDVPDGIGVDGQVQGLTIANLTIRDVYHDAIMFGAGTMAPHVFNVHLVDAGDRFIRGAGDGTAGVSGALIEGSVFEFTGTARDSDAKGIEVFTGADWIIRDNTFRNIVGPSRQFAGPALVLSRGSRNTVTERNWFLNVTTGVAYGVSDVAGFDHTAGIIRNNFFFRSSTQPGGAAITLADSPGTWIVNNTVFLSGTNGVSIDYRFAGTTDVLIANNLMDGIIAASDGATGIESNNLPGASAGLFVDASAGDLRLNPAASGAIDRGATLGAVTDDWARRLRPAGRGYDIGADEYGADRAGYEIRGRVIDASSGDGLAGMTVTLSGARSQTAITDSSGVFAFGNLAGRVDYTATPSTAGQQTTPASLFFPSLSGNQNAADFTAWTPATTRVSTAVNHPPKVNITSPSNGAVYSAPADIVVTASARDRDTYVAKVAFYAGSTLIGSDTASPFKAKWNSVPAGSYTLTAVATDTKGLSTTSSPITIQVTPAAASAAGNQPPSVSLSGPVSGSVYTAPASMTVSAAASDADGSISKVDFYAGSSLIGTKSASPYQIAWSGVAAGTYSLTAVATDNSGATTRSGAVGVTVNPAGTAAPATSGVWVPPMSTSWQWQLTTPVDQSVDVAMYDIDMFDNDASVVASLHAKGRKVICYISAGTFENWRPDASLFPDSVKGNSNGWPGEKWLDIRQLNVLAPILEARMDLCKQKGFDGIEPDNVDGYTNKTGFPLTAQNQITFNTWLAAAAHARGLSVGLKNDIDQAADLVGSFDWTLNEQCFEYSECGTLAPFTQAGKAVFEVEYNLSTSQFCPKAAALEFNSMKKNLDLDAPRTACTP